MKTVSQEIQDLSIKSLESTFNKLSNAYKSLTDNNPCHKRRSAVKIGLRSLKDACNGVGFFYDEKNHIDF